LKIIHYASKDQLLIPLYLPTLIFSISEGLLIPILPLYASDAGFSYAIIGIILAGESIGMLLGDIPSGILIRKIGHKYVMIFGLGLSALSTLTLFWTQSFWVILLLRIIAGFGAAMFNVSRFVYLAEFAKKMIRGRASALFGGFKRIGAFIGPTIAGVIATAYGLRVPFILFAASLGLVMAIVANSISVNDVTIPVTRKISSPLRSNHLMSLLRYHSKILITAGSGNFFMMMIRSVPVVIIPLYSANVIGLDVQQIGFIMSLSSAIDMLLFYPAGVIMDHFGRKYAINISLLILSIGIASIPLTFSFQSILLAAMITGAGNGIGSGTMLALGADIAPPDIKGEFLGTWLLIGNLGSLSGPLIIGGIASVFLLSQAALTMAGLGLIGICTFLVFVPETLSKKLHV
jgi:MFS family permease